jgi:hypothetical protein
MWMVKIKRSSSKKRYLKGKRVYSYFRFYLLVPRKFFQKLEPYCNEDFQVEMADDEKEVAITFRYKKTSNDKTPTSNFLRYECREQKKVAKKRFGTPKGTLAK